MKFSLRDAKTDDAEAILKVHRSAIRASGDSFYPPEVIAEWAGPITDENIQKQKDKLQSEEQNTIVAVSEGNIVGFATVVPEQGELRAVYISGDAQGDGIGSTLLNAVEERARSHGVSKLQMDSSLMAAPFYSAHGYVNKGAGEHTMSSGQTMACVKMTKDL